ncbi:MAG: AAA family ATPase, partial [Paracoccus sp. (in: a-proteobacteria)]
MTDDHNPDDPQSPWDAMAQAGPRMSDEPKPGPTVINMAQKRQNRARAEGKRASRFFAAAALDGRDVPERNWLVRDQIPSGTVTLLSGDGGTGKSLIALQLAAACALGKPWLGHAVASGQALFISAEDDQDELHRRLADVIKAEGVGFADLDRLTLRSLAGEDALLTALDARTGIQKATALFREIDAYMIELQPAVVVLDTLADLFPGNENDRGQARQFIGLLRGLAIRHGCAVLLLAHPSLSGIQNGTGLSGSTGWNNSVRSRLYLRRVIQGEDEPNPDARVLETMKANYAATGAEIALTWRNGVFEADPAETGLDRMARRSKA